MAAPVSFSVSVPDDGAAHALAAVSQAIPPPPRPQVSCVSDNGCTWAPGSGDIPVGGLVEVVTAADGFELVSVTLDGAEQIPASG